MARGHRAILGREAMAPPPARHLVPQFGMAMLEVEPEQSHRSDHLTGLDQLDCPADGVASRVALIEPLKQGLRLRKGMLVGTL
jgi:hypothetical protein